MTAFHLSLLNLSNGKVLRFANLDEVVLKLRGSTDLFRKRGGWKTAMAK